MHLQPLTARAQNIAIYAAQFATPAETPAHAHVRANVLLQVHKSLIVAILAHTHTFKPRGRALTVYFSSEQLLRGAAQRTDMWGARVGDDHVIGMCQS